MILGILQGLTEFFPISSSAHLQLARILLNVQEPSQFFDLICHLGTLTAAVFYLRKDICKVFSSLRLFSLFAVALIPLAFVYFFLHSSLKEYSHPHYMGYFLFLTAALLWSSTLIKQKKTQFPQHKFRDVLLIGLMQSMALVPGISRSGSTIAAARFRGWNIQDAVRFSFLLAIPTVFGGTLLESMKIIHQRNDLSGGSTIMYAAGFFASLITGLFSIRLIFWSLNKNVLRGFAIYCILAGTIALIIT